MWEEEKRIFAGQHAVLLVSLPCSSPEKAVLSEAVLLSVPRLRLQFVLRGQNFLQHFWWVSLALHIACDCVVDLGPGMAHQKHFEAVSNSAAGDSSFGSVLLLTDDAN